MITETGLGCDEFADDDSDHCKRNGYLEPGEEMRTAAGKRTFI